MLPPRRGDTFVSEARAPPRSSSCSRRSPWRTNLAQGTAKERYLLTDRDLGKLGFITKANPQHKTWSEMKLYLELQVRHF